MAANVPQHQDLEDFSRAYAEFEQYPGHAALPGAAELNSRLLSHYQRHFLRHPIDQTLPLFVDDKDQKVAFREVRKDGKVIKWNCFSDHDLKSWLHDDPEGPSLQVDPDFPRRPDPPCRFIYLLNDDRGKPLQISKSSLQRLLTFHQVSWNFLELLDVYRGTWNDDHELRSSIFRASGVVDEPRPATVVPSLGRHGRRYQVSSGLKVPAIRDGPSGKFYKIRQVALHHQFDMQSGVQLWIVGDPHSLVKKQIQAFIPMKRNNKTFENLQTSLRSSLDIHLELFGWLVEEWGAYIADLQDDINQLTEIIIHNHGREVNGGPPVRTPLRRLPTVAVIQKRADEADRGLAALSANDRVLESLEMFYKQTWEKARLDDNETGEYCGKLIGLFRANLSDLRAQGDQQMGHVKGLKHTVERRMELLSKTMERRTTEEVNKQALRSADEASLMRIITIITLIYLPPTFTSTFFSMEVFKEVGVTMWAIVCVPLLAVTITLALLAGRRALHNARGKDDGDVEANGGEYVDGGNKLFKPFRAPVRHVHTVANGLWTSLTNGNYDDGVEKGGIMGLGRLKTRFQEMLLRIRGTKTIEDLESPLSSPEHEGRRLGK